MSKVDRELVEMLERPVDVKKLVDRLFFNADALEHAAIRQPKLFLESGRFRAQRVLELARLKRKLGKVVAKTATKYRRKLDYKAEKEITDKVNMDSNVQHYQKRLDEADVIAEFAHQLSKAYEERVMIISVLARIYSSEMHSGLRSVENKEVVDKMRKKAKAVRKRFEEIGDEDEF